MKDSSVSYKWYLLGFLWVAYFLQQGTRQIYNAIIPQIQTDFNVSSVQIGLVATGFILMYGLCVPVVGLVSDFFSRKWMIVLGILIFSLGIFLSGFVSTIGLLFVTYGLINGTGQSFYYPPASSLLSQLHEKMRATAISIHQTAQYLGIVICSCVAGYLGSLPSEGGFAGWRLPFLLFGGIGIVWAIFLAFFMSDTKQKSLSKEQAANRDKDRVSLKDAFLMMFRKPSAIIMSIAFGGMVYVDTGFKTWMPTYIYETFNMSLGEAAFNAVIWHYIGAFLGVMFGSRFTDKFMSKGVITIRYDAGAFGFLVGAPFIYMMVSSPTSFSICMAGLFLFGIFRGIADAGIFVCFLDVIPARYRASAMGLMICIGFIIGSTSSTVLGWMRGEFGLTNGIASLAIFYVINAIIIMIARIFFLRKDFEAD